nr:hypothetical protein GCM10025732_25800 [Glycomyces mayteni]
MRRWNWHLTQHADGVAWGHFQLWWGRFDGVDRNTTESYLTQIDIVKHSQSRI